MTNKHACTKRYNLLLINPIQRLKHYSIQSKMAELMGKKNIISTLSLPLIAALTPDNYSIRIIDEEVESIPENISADIVGITTLSNTVTRAYEIADLFRERDIPVVLGGPHVTYAVDEGLEHADCICAGEVESVWFKLLADFENGCLKSVYKADKPVTFETSPVPRWDLMKVKEYLSIPLQVTRGCPYNCEFCLVTKMFGKKPRIRDLDDIKREIESLPMKRLFFVDDNLTINRPFARELMELLKNMHVSWTCQVSIDIAKDAELLRSMAASGCDQMLVGFESLNPESLKEAHKYHNLRSDYREAIEKIHAAGIHVLASFVIGFDHDTVDEFKNIYNFSMETRIPFVTLNILGCSPGTELHGRMQKEGRLWNAPAEFKGGMFPVIHYKQISQEAIFSALLDTLEKLYSFDTIYKKVYPLFASGCFTKPIEGHGHSILRKVLISLKVISIYLIRGNKIKRKLFIELIKLFRQKKVAIDRLIIMLLSMEGFNQYIAELQAEKGKYIEIIRRINKESA